MSYSEVRVPSLRSSVLQVSDLVNVSSLSLVGVAAAFSYYPWIISMSFFVVVVAVIELFKFYISDFLYYIL